MSKLEEYRKWCAKHYRESVGFDLADPAIAELEAENKSQVEKTIEARQETHLAIIQKRQAEAALAERDRMLDEWWKWSVHQHFTPSMSRVAWFDRLRASAKEEGA